MIAGNILHGSSISLWNYLMDSASSKVALDIGANRGDYTNILLMHGFEHVYSFEPVPVFFSELSAQHGSNPCVTCINKGLSDTAGIVRDVTVLSACTIARPEQTKSLEVCPSFAGLPYFDMETITLDEFIDEHPSPIGFIKLDVDGYEFRVMRGGNRMLLRDHPSILCELGHYVPQLGDSVREWIEYVFSLDYVITPLDGSFLFRTWEQIEPWYPFHTTFDVLFVPSLKIPSLKTSFPLTSAPTGIKINRAPWHTT